MRWSTADYFVFGAFISICWALWIRRMTWGFYWENAATATVLTQGVGLLLATPLASNTLGVWLQSPLHRYNLNEWMAQACALAAPAALVLHVMIRLQPMGQHLQCRYRRTVGLPLTFTVPVMLALLCRSDASKQPHPDWPAVDLDGWLAAYWLLFCAVCIYLMVLLSVLLMEVRVDKRSRWLADWYLVATTFGIIAAAARTATVLYNDPTNGRYMWIAGSLSVTIFAAGAGWSWYLKLHPWHSKQLRPRTRAPTGQRYQL